MKNYYIERDDGNIVGLYARPQYDEQEVLAEDDQEMIDHFAAEQAAKDIENVHIAEIEVEKENAGLKNITVAQAHEKIDQIFEGATTIALLRAAIIMALKKMIPYILR